MIPADLHKRAQQLALRHATLSGSYQTALNRQKTLVEEVSQAKARLTLNDEIKRVFEALQTRAHERSVGAFEQLLTALIDDVMPGEGSVRFIPKFRDSRTWLDIMIQKGDNLEDILEGNGGALTNIVSTGLRYAALSRTKNRSLMVLDEPDCWIKPSVVPAFINVICEVANQTGVQTMFVSHYDDPDMFSNLANVIRLNRDKDGNPVAEVVQPIHQNWTDNETPGIRKIELYNVRKHISTVIPCFPGATAIVGDNNLGKSTAIATALRAVAYGESDESIINHDAQEAQIVIHLENEYRLEWSRARKRARTVTYRLFQGTSAEPIREGYPPSRNSAPDWVSELLGVSRVDDMDIQVGNQKVPVFLLNESASRRASLLSMGRESGHLASLMTEYESVRREDLDTSRRGERELVGLTEMVEYLSPVEDLTFTKEILQEAAQELVTDASQQQQLEQVVSRLTQHETRLHQFLEESTLLATLPALVELEDTEKLEALIARTARSTTLLSVLDIPQAVALPSIDDTKLLDSTINAIARLTRRLTAQEPLALIALPTLPSMALDAQLAHYVTQIERSQKRLQVLEAANPEIPALPALQDEQQLSHAIEQQESRLRRDALLSKEIAKLAQEEAQVLEELSALKQQLGVCPLCESNFEEEHSHA